MGILLAGPAGGGKSQVARDLLATLDRPGAIVDFQSILAALTLQLRGDDGRYPERNPSQSYLLALTAYVYRAAITGARAQDVDVIATTSDGNPTRRLELLALLGPGSTERIIEPLGGRLEVEARLSRDGVLSEQCREAINRWYGRFVQERRDRRANG